MLVRLMLPGESMKTLSFEKILLPEYQGNDIENCLVLSLIYQITFGNTPGFNRSVPLSCVLSSWDNGILLNKLFTQGEEFSTCQKESTC